MNLTARLTGRLRRTLWALNIFGPIFGKELRTSSRQRRNYVLRTLYVAVLTVVIGLVWLSIMSFGRMNPLYRSARMSEVGLELLATIGAFQFAALHLIAPILTCTAISDEITHRTLGTLMMTPLNTLQIVAGKLFSKLLTMILLVAISLPLLAIIRVFGGIEWDLVFSILALTVCSALFAAAISLTLSVFHKRAYAAILMTYITLAAIYFLIPLLIAAAMDFRGPDYFCYFNPVVSLIQVIEQGTRPARRVFFGWSAPPIQCGLLLLATFGLMLLAATLVRRASLRLAAGEQILQRRRRRRRTAAGAQSMDVGTEVHRQARPVTGNPILWREIRVPVLPTRRKRIILIAAVIIALGLTYLAIGDDLDEEEAHIFYSITFLLVTLLVAAVLPATLITSEKESSTWDAVLVTPLRPVHILIGKAAGAVRRVLPVALLFFGHVVIFCAVGIIHPLAVVHTFLLLAGPVILLIGTGIYFGLRVRRTTTAVMLNLGLGIFLWAIVPMLALLIGEAMHEGDDLAEATVTVNPVVLDAFSFEELAGNWPRGRSLARMHFDWVNGSLNAIEFTSWLVMTSLVYGAGGVFAMAWAASRFRRLTRS